MNARLIAFLILAAYSAADAGTLTTLHTFTGGPGDGAIPWSGVALGPGGVLYGTTGYGGVGPCYLGCGTVFSLTPPASPGGLWTESVYPFPFPKTGEMPWGSVAVSRGGALYGTTLFGGNCGSLGTVFELKPPASGGASWAERLLFNTCGTDALTTSPVIDPGGVLYIATNSIANARAPGNILTLSPPSSGSGGPWTETVLYSGLSEPNAIVIGANGVLYGTTYGGGVDNSSCDAAGCGSVYSLTPPTAPGGTWTAHTLYNFTGSDGNGSSPQAGVTIGPNGVLYGTTFYGGNAGCSPNGCGTVFSLAPPASPGGVWAETILYRFTGGNAGNSPQAALAIGRKGVLYGTTTSGGESNCDANDGCGTVFSLTPPASAGGVWTQAVLIPSPVIATAALPQPGW